MNTETLIQSLSQQAPPVAVLRPPRHWGARIVGVLGIYGLAVQYFLGLRPDLLLQLSRPLFAVEIFLLVALIFTSAVATILAMYPDAYQKPALLKLPYGIFGVLVLLMTIQLLLPHDASMVMPPLGAHALECALCIGVVALIPSAILFMIVRKGASVVGWHAGAFAVLAASGVGCLTLRLAELNDSIEHLLQWHYVPTLLFAAGGALIGKWLLRW